MDDQTKEALKIVDALLEFKKVVEAELQQHFPDAQAEFNLAVGTSGSAEPQATLVLQVETPHEDMKAEVADYTDANMERWMQGLHANGLGVHSPKLVVK